MVIIKGKIKKFGNSYCIGIKKALIDSDVLRLGEEITLEVTADGGILAHNLSNDQTYLNNFFKGAIA